MLFYGHYIYQQSSEACGWSGHGSFSEQRAEGNVIKRGSLNLLLLTPCSVFEQGSYYLHRGVLFSGCGAVFPLPTFLLSALCKG